MRFGFSQSKALEHLKNIMSKNKQTKSLIGKGFNNTITPSPIKRHVLENPKWYTPYSPYQAEISQGRLESLYNFQTMIQEFTELPISNCSLLDIGSTASEVLSMSKAYHKDKRNKFFVSETMHPYILDILEKKCEVSNINLVIGKAQNFSICDDTIGVMIQYPDTYGSINIPTNILQDANENKSVVSCATDLLTLTKYDTPGKIGADIAFGSAQRFGVPLYYGGPHPAFLSCKKDFLRLVPGRIVGKTIDQQKNPCYRLALQSREQHIRRDKATSNICTSQALLANIAAFYAIYHGRDGLNEIAQSIYNKTNKLKKHIDLFGFMTINENFFDTITIIHGKSEIIYEELKKEGYLTFYDKNEPYYLTISVDETIENDDVSKICKILEKYSNFKTFLEPKIENIKIESNLLKSEIFNKKMDETEFTRYAYSLTKKDYSLTEGMIPLGSCTMKLNAAYQLEPMSWDSVANIHPFAPKDYALGYERLLEETGDYLKEITGFQHVSFQSNSGAMGEYTALLCIKKYFNNKRNICIIPDSAHGTNFASASLANMKIITFKDELFNDINEFSKFVEKYNDELACMMITYPNTNGIFQKNIEKINDIIHKNGGLVYLDGANMNALAGKITASEIGADVCHLNLHKTFCIPHGGGGPGMGPILTNDKLGEYLPTHIFQSNNKDKETSIGTITASQWSSASLLTIPYLYFKEKEIKGIAEATEKAIKNANYMKNKLAPYYKVPNEAVAHEFIIDVNEFKSKDITEVDISKRLIDYSFHPPTMSWPKKGTLMIEPTESESQEELDRFINAMIKIRKEIDENPEVIKNAPHPVTLITDWNFNYSMEKAFFPDINLKNNKFWPSTSRIDDIYGDKLMYKN